MTTQQKDGLFWGRRKFTATLTTLASSTLLIPSEFNMAESVNQPKQKLSVQQVIDLIIKTIPGAPFPETVDTVKAGSSDQQVTGIVTTTFATVEVIEKTAGLGANFIIVHEPTFYNHLDETDWLEQDEVYRYKKDLLNKHNIAVWRFHDYWHSHRPDGVQMGVLTALGWDKYVNKDTLHMITLPATPLEEIVTHVKAKLGIPMVRVMGEPSQVCQRVALLPGAPGGRRQITAVQKEKPDLLICGELSEWETSEYVRDALQMGQKLALIILGHAVSEEPGMQWLVQWLQPKLPDTKITHVPAQNSFTWT